MRDEGARRNIWKMVDDPLERRFSWETQSGLMIIVISWLSAMRGWLMGLRRRGGIEGDFLGN